MRVSVRITDVNSFVKGCGAISSMLLLLTSSKGWGECWICVPPIWQRTCQAPPQSALVTETD